MSVANGERVWIATDTAAEAVRFGVRAKRWGLNEDEILVIADDTKGDPRVAQILGSEDPGLWLAANPHIKFVAVTPIAVSGWSVVTRSPWTEILWFDGSSIAPAQACQQSYRLRNPAKVIAFVANHGNRSSKIKAWGKDGLKTSEAERLGYLRQALSFSGLGFDVSAGDEFDEYRIERLVRENEERYWFAECLGAYLTRDGWDVQVQWHEGGKPEPEQEIEEEARRIRALPFNQARRITPEEFEVYRSKPELTHTERLEFEAYQIRQHLGKAWDEPLSIEDVIAEGFGKGRRQTRAGAIALVEGYALSLDRRRLEEMGSAGCPWDISTHTLTAEAIDRLGILDALAHYIEQSERGEEVLPTDPVIADMWSRFTPLQGTIDRLNILGVNCGGVDDPMTLLGRILDSWGIKTKATRRRANGLMRSYLIDLETLATFRQRMRTKLEILAVEGFEVRSIRSVKVILGNMDHPLIITPNGINGGQHLEENPSMDISQNPIA